MAPLSWKPRKVSTDNRSRQKVDTKFTSGKSGRTDKKDGRVIGSLPSKINTHISIVPLSSPSEQQSPLSAQTATFDATGIRTASFNSGDVHGGFGGQWGYYTDPETGLQLCGTRYYDAAAGRFLTRDPIDYEGGVNLYNYVGNNPVNDIDPAGTKSCAQLKREIKSLADSLEKRWDDMWMDKGHQFDHPNIPTPGIEGTWNGHQHRYQSEQDQLKQKIQEYKNNGCNKDPGGGALPADSYKWRDKCAPSSPSWHNPTEPGLKDETDWLFWLILSLSGGGSKLGGGGRGRIMRPSEPVPILKKAA